MYKLFLCLKYLRRRYLALIAVAAVALCVAMVLIVVSVYDGFLGKVESAAKGLFGEIIVDSPSLSAIGRYDEFISLLTGEYRVGADFELTEVKAEGQTSSAVFRARTGPTHAQALAGDSQFKTPVTRPARGALFQAGRRLGEVQGTLVVHPGRLNPDTEEFEYEMHLTGRTALPPEQLADPANPIRLRAVYVKVGEGVEEIDSATGVIYTYGLLRIGRSFTTMVQICGIRLPERLAVTDFGSGLFVQTGRADACFEPPLADMLARTGRHLELIGEIDRRERDRSAGSRDAELIRKLGTARENAVETQMRLAGAGELRRRLRRLQAALSAERAKPADQRNAKQIDALSQGIRQVSLQLHEAIRSGQERVILGLGIAGLSFRTPEGRTIRWVTPGQVVKLTLWPLRRGLQSTTVQPTIGTFLAVDDVKTDVWTVDSTTVYVPFDRLQALADMAARPYAADPSKVEPALCSQIQIKVKPAFSADGRLIDARSKVAALWREFELKHPDAAQSEILIHTWREKLAKFIGPVQKQRTLVTIMFGIISSVSVLLIFAIFYMIVMQKIRDIGVVRAVGGSAAGVAEVFLGYGAATGLVGSILGLVGGYYFVRYINEIEDVLASWWGFRVWERDVFLFEKIPNEVDPAVALVIAIWAIVSGLVGALIPAVRAAVMEPAEAVRYE